jgi:hypothetical protein
LGQTETRPLSGFAASPYWREQLRVLQLSNVGLDAVTVQLNAPAADHWHVDSCTRLVLYCLPNGNTINQTVGRTAGPGVDWHYAIQHIGAQTRRV